MPALEHQSRLGDIGIAGVGAASDEYLLNLLFLHILKRNHVVRLVRTCAEGNQFAQIQLHFPVVGAALVRGQLHKVRLPLLGLQEFSDLLIRRENGGGRAHLSAHVGNSRALVHRQGGGSRAHILKDLAQSALDAHPAQHLQNHFLGVAAWLQVAGQVYFNNLRHFKTHGGGYVHAAHADAQHADGAAVGRVAVAAHAQLAGRAEAGHLDGVADAVAGPGHVNPVALGHGLQVNVVVRRLVVQIQQVVVQVADAGLHLGSVQADGLEGQIGHHRVDVMGQGLVHFQEDLLPRDHVRRLCQMGRQNLFRQIHVHVSSSRFLKFG